MRRQLTPIFFLISALILSSAEVKAKPNQLKHTAPVKALSHSPDGKQLATASYHRSIIIWDLKTWKPIRMMKGHASDIWTMSYSPDGKRLATGSTDSTTIIWNPTTGKRLLTLKGHAGWILDLSFSPDGKYLATASRDDTAIVWSTKSGKKIHALKGHSEDVNAIRFSPDGKFLVTGSSDETAIIWDAKTGKQIHKIRCGQSIYELKFSPNGKELALSGEVVTTVREVKDWQRIQILKSDGLIILASAYSPDGNLFAVSSAFRKNNVVIWNMQEGTRLRSLKGHTGLVRDLSFSRDGKHLVSTGDDDRVIVWDARSGKQLRVLQRP